MHPPRHRVLLVEDDATTREALTTLLVLGGFTVTAACTGEDALAQLRGGLRPCVILLDLIMPRMDGLQFREAQIADRELAAIPLVILSGAGRLEPRAAQLGVRVYVDKPPDVRRLATVLAGCCIETLATSVPS